jgi:protease PrsW
MVPYQAPAPAMYSPGPTLQVQSSGYPRSPWGGGWGYGGGGGGRGYGGYDYAALYDAYMQGRIDGLTFTMMINGLGGGGYGGSYGYGFGYYSSGYPRRRRRRRSGSRSLFGPWGGYGLPMLGIGWPFDDDDDDDDDDR